MPKKVMTGVLAACCLLAAGCADNLTTEVTRFHVLPPPGGETLQIVQADPDQDQSLKFSDVARRISDRFGALGYRPAAPGTPADIVARLSYGVSPGPIIAREPNAETGAEAGPAAGRGSRGDPSGNSDAAPGPGGPKFLHRLRLVMVRQSDGGVLFEGNATSLGRRAGMEPVMPYLIDAMFANFPGESGTTTRITVDLAAQAKSPSRSGK